DILLTSPSTYIWNPSNDADFGFEHSRSFEDPYNANFQLPTPNAVRLQCSEVRLTSEDHGNDQPESTPIVSPDSYFLGAEYTVLGPYFSPLCSPVLNSQSQLPSVSGE